MKSAEEEIIQSTDPYAEFQIKLIEIVTTVQTAVINRTLI